MINWIKNTIGKVGGKHGNVNYVVAEFHAVKKNEARTLAMAKAKARMGGHEARLDYSRGRFNETMEIDKLHSKN